MQLENKIIILDRCVCLLSDITRPCDDQTTDTRSGL